MAYRPKHFKIHASIRNHSKTALLYADNDLLSAYLRIGVLAIERFADRNENSFTVHEREFQEITGKRRADVARKMMLRLTELSPICVEPEPDLRRTCDGPAADLAATSQAAADHLWRITIPNLRIKQGFKSEAVSKPSPSSSSSSSPPPSSSNTDTEPEPSAPPPNPPTSEPELRKVKKPRPIKTLCPERLAPHQRDKLVAWAEKRGMSVAQVRHAFNVVKDWSTGGGKLRSDWVATTRNAIRDGWAMKGYVESDGDRFSRELEKSPYSLTAVGAPPHD